MRRTGFALLAFLTPMASAHAADPNYGKLRITCDAAASVLEIGEMGAGAARNASVVDWRALIKMGPQKNQRGEPLRTGSRSVTHRCGVYTVRVKGGYLSPNPTGQDGAYEFGVADVLLNQKAIVPPTAFFACEQMTPRFEDFGPCPKAWAQTVRIAWSPTTGKSKVTIRRVYEDRSYEERAVRDEFEVGAERR